MLQLIKPLPLRQMRTPISCLACAFQQPQKSSFSTTAVVEARKKQKPKMDRRITLIRYFLQHPLTPRPLRFSRNRYLRHWTIHRAWQLFQSKVRQKRELELERQYNSMRGACEALRLMDGNGVQVDAESVDATKAKDVGRLYRIAMLKNDVWNGVPIEYARIQTHTPSRDG
ncbi:hypothetical protein B9Z65_4932 [Elsinoe australis]|uniref:54S ribosomal protein L28, mitochondrial n=1 Tax=Elsinoe australis TaxID=40998 RepID=A0A2P8A6G1_9PEZI|nr:hypothetical protein B9Z65_4932 [Elsinoe australis]